MTEYGPRRILVVDDDSIIRNLMEHMLVREGHKVDMAESGEAALQKLPPYATLPDVIFADLQLPGIHGRRFADEVHTRCGDHVRMIAMSGSEAGGGALEGFDDFLRKPFTVDRLKLLLAAIENHEEAKHSASAAEEFLCESVFRKLASSMSRQKLAEFYVVCLEDTRKRVGVIREAASRNDDAACRRQAHAIQGSCSMVGAAEIHALAESIEKRGLDAATPVTLDLLLQACNRLEGILAKDKFAPENMTERTGRDYA